MDYIYYIYTPKPGPMAAEHPNPKYEITSDGHQPYYESY